MSEQWIVVNLTTKSFTVGIPGTPSLTSGSSFDLLAYTDKTTVCTAARLIELIQNRQVIVNKYQDSALVVSVDYRNVTTQLCEASTPAPIPAVTPEELAAKADKVSGATSGNFASLNDSGNIVDSGSNASDFAAKVHEHAIGDVQGLEAALDAKANPADLAAHEADHNNPHATTAAQVGAYSTAQTDALLAEKANLQHCHEITDIIGLPDALARCCSGFSGTGGGGSGASGLSGWSGISGFSGTSAPMFTQSFVIATWQTTGSDYYITFTHNLNSTNLVVAVWNDTSGTPEKVDVERLVLNDLNSLTIHISKVPDYRFIGHLSINGGGQQGYSGFSGAKGDPGGLSGISGYSGAAGFIGSDGASGFSGYSGAAGFVGSDGASGYSGFSGSAGTSGYSGTSGVSGFSGTSGVSGYSGRSGYSGTSGYSGAIGISGYSGAANQLYTEEAPQTVSAGTAITVTDGWPVSPISTPTSATVTMTATPTIANGRTGQLAILMNVGTGSITVQDMGTLGGSNLRLGASTRTLSPLRGLLELIYDPTMGGWVENTFSNVLAFTASISAFTIDGSSGPTREVAASSTVDNSAGGSNQPAFAITYVGVPSAASIDISSGEISPSDYPITLPSPYTSLTSSTTPSSATFYRQTTVGGTCTFTVTATASGTSGLTRTVTITYLNRRYAGANSQSTALSTSQILALSTSDLTNSQNGSFAVTSSTGQYIWFAHRAALTSVSYFAISITGTTSVMGGNQIAGFTLVSSTVSHTNQFGFNENFKVYRTTNTNFGSVTLTTTSTQPTNRFYMGPNTATAITDAQILTLDDTTSGQSRLGLTQAAANNPNGGGTQGGWGNASPGAGVPATAITVTGSNYFWYCHPASLADLSTIKDHSTGFGIAGSYQTNVSHTNDMGYTETYRCWRSDNTGVFPSGGQVDIT